MTPSASPTRAPLASRSRFAGWRGYRWPIGIAIAIAMLVGFGREMGELAYIGLSRGRDKVQETISNPTFDRPYDEVVNANTEQTLEIEQYLADLRLRAAGTTESLSLDFSSASSFARSRGKLRSLLAASLSYPPPHLLAATEPPVMTRLAEDEIATYYDLNVPVLEKVNARGVFMMPRNASGKVPLVIAAHGRGGMPPRPKNGRLTVVGLNNRDLALGALQKGYAVWEPILVFYARGRPDDIRDRLEVRAREVGTSLPAIEIAKITGGLDAILRTQRIDVARIAMVGVSYGGFYTLYTAALDERIRVAVVAAYVNDRAAILDSTEPAGMPDWRFPNSLSLFRDENVAALVCPRPLQIQAGDHDQLFPIEGARKTARMVRELYARLENADNFSYREFVGRHDFDGSAAWEFIGRAFTAEPARREQEAR